MLFTSSPLLTADAAPLSPLSSARPARHSPLDSVLSTIAAQTYLHGRNPLTIEFTLGRPKWLRFRAVGRSLTDFGIIDFAPNLHIQILTTRGVVVAESAGDSTESRAAQWTASKTLPTFRDAPGNALLAAELAPGRYQVVFFGVGPKRAGYFHADLSELYPGDADVFAHAVLRVSGVASQPCALTAQFEIHPDAGNLRLRGRCLPGWNASPPTGQLLVVTHADAPQNPTSVTSHLPIEIKIDPVGASSVAAQISGAAGSAGVELSLEPSGV